ncbi:hypothetical protein E6H36_03090 [Candidatus Bathyarchaeota archaeon]|nr:MAG: hypothetical protein E6H36_03090 [Candidatus Bathyarchaeota archaeon]TMI31836.1 MAG: hypothetical protein E6H29_03770 [Candidatus Bathyarchaeota archaeon]
MSGESVSPRKSWLSALALLTFLPAFGLARLFTYFLPRVVVEQSGIHFHHFWYGIILLAASGWLGIAGDVRWTRLAAIMYGLGGGLLADEVGLLLTLGDYQTELTYTVVVGAVGVLGTLSVFQRYGREIGLELKKFTLSERVAYFALFILVLPLLILSLAQVQASTVGLIAAFLYRAKFGGAWRISRKQFSAELAGFLPVLPIIIVPGLVSGYLVDAAFGPLMNQGEPPLSLLPVLILAGIGVDVIAGLVGGWIWVRILRRAANPATRL